MNRYQLLVSFMILTYGPVGTIAQTVSVLTEHLPPYQSVNDNEISGLATDVVHAVFNHANVNYIIEADKWADAYRMTLKHPMTCLYSTARLPQRETDFYWVGEIASLSTSFYALKNKNITLNSLEQAKNFKIAVLKDDASHHFLIGKGFNEDEHFYVHNNYSTLFSLLSLPSRNIDLVITANNLLPYRLNTNQNENNFREVMKINELTLHFFLACNKEMAAHLKSTLSTSMMVLEKQGTLKEIRQKWTNIE